MKLHNAERVQTRAVAKAEQLGDTAALASGVDGLGLFMWRRYEPLANRRYGVLNLGYTANDFVLEPYKFRLYFDEATRPFIPPLGEVVYREAERNFSRARALNVDDELAFRHHTMLLAERERC